MLSRMRFFTGWERARVENKLLMVAVALLAAVILVLSTALKSAYSNQKIIVLPPQVTQEFWVAGDTFSSSYFEQMAFYLSDRLLTVSPQTVNASFNSIINFIDPLLMRHFRESLNEQAKTIVRERVFQVFYPAQFAVDTNKKVMTVKGMLKRFSGNVFQYEAETVITFGFYVQEGRLYITSIEM